MAQRFRTLALAAILAGVGGLAPVGDGFAQQTARNDAALEQLAGQARFWEQRNRPELAIESWQRLLAADPRDEEALGRLAALAHASGDTRAANDYSDRLRTLNPQSRWLRDIEVSRATASIDAATLNRARQLASSERNADALAAYRQAFGGEPPTDAYALEYYQVMAGDAERRPEAQRNLERLARDNAANPTYELAAARLQTWSPGSRRQGIARLQRLQEQPAVREDARSAWRQALIWLEATPADESLYDAYLRVVTDDREVASRRAELRAQRPDSPQRQRDARLQQAFERLDAGDLTAAESGFQDVLRGTPRQSDALGGLGIVRLRQERYPEADSLLRQAIEARPAQAGRWREASRSAAFFSRYQTAEVARQDGDLPRALREYRAAFAAPPAGLDPALRLPLADTLMEAGDDTAAERELRDILAARPGQPDALRQLAQLLARTGRSAEAERLAAQGPAEVQAAIAPARAEALRERASIAAAAGDSDAARRDLREAMALAPNNPWVRLDLARLLRANGQGLDADVLLDSLRQTHPDLPDVTIAQAYALADAERWLDVLYELEQLAPRDRNRDARALQHQAWVQYQVQRSGLAVENGDLETAYAAMAAADRAAAGDPSFLPALAGGWAGLGDPARALGYMRRSFDGRPASLDQRIQYTALLLELGQDAEFEASADLLLRQSLSPEQGRTLEGLVVGYRIKLADRARERGDLAGAYDLLRDVVPRRPQEARVQMALARVFDAAGDHDQSLAIYDGLLRREPDNRDVIYGAANAALGSGDPDRAAPRVRAARNAAPDAAEADEFAARLAELRGNPGLALRHYEQAARKRARAPAEAPPRPPQLQLLGAEESCAPLMPRPVADSASTLAVPPQRALRPRPSAFETPVAPRGEAAPSQTFGPGPIAAGLRMSADTNAGNRRTYRDPATRSSQPEARPLQLRSEERLRSGGSDTATATATPYRTTSPFPQHETTRRAPTPRTPPPRASRDGGATIPVDNENLQRLRADNSGWLGGGMHSRVRDGESGLSRLFNIEVPMEAWSTTSPAGAFGVRLVPVYADSGSASGQQALRWGALPLIDGGNGSGSQSQSGIAVGLGYRLGNFSADIGTTPLGFEEERITGGLNWTPTFGPWRLGVDVSRRPVTDSLLAYAGLRDPLLGASWGGVNRTRGRLDLAYDLGRLGVYGNLGFAHYDGRNTDDNAAGEIGGGVYARAWRDPRATLTYGLNITTFFYDKNRRHFSFGHGGYFSPQSFIGVTVPVDLTGTWGDLSYRVYAALGLQTFREDGAAMFPNHANLQTELDNILLANPASEVAGGYASNSQSGLGYAFGGSLEYRVAPQLFVGGTLGTDNARDYTEYHFSGFLRYYFHQQPFMPLAPRPLPAHFNAGG